MNNLPKNSRPETFTASQVGVLIEEFQTQFRAFGEGLNALRAKVDLLYNEFGHQKEELFLIKRDIFLIKKDTSEMKGFLKSHDKRLSRLELSIK